LSVGGHALSFLLPAAIKIAMAGGIWLVLVIPAIIAFIFSVWVLYSVMVDVSQREDSAFSVVGPDKVRITVEPGG
jgi:hypothetical protein